MKNIISLRKATAVAIAAVAIACAISTNAKVSPVPAENNVPFFRIFKNDKTVEHIAVADSLKIGFDGASGVKFWYGQNKGIRLNYSQIDSCGFVQTAIPTFHFRFPDYPGYDQVRDKENYIRAELDIVGNGYMEDINGLSLQVKGRGNSTWNMWKKPMRLKFSKKTELGPLKKAKNYVMLANYMDNSLIRNAVAYWLAKKVGVEYTNNVFPCDVVVNDYFIGSFMVTEKLGINSATVDIDENEGILFELSDDMDEAWQFHSDDYNLPIMVKDPDFDELEEDYPEGGTAEERFNAWKQDLTAALKMVKKGTPFEAFDKESYARYMFVFDIMCNQELRFPKSSYVYKKKIGEDEKYYFGPIWDFDKSCNVVIGSTGEKVENDRRGKLQFHSFYGAIFNLPELQDCYYKYVEWFAKEGINELMDYIDDYTSYIYNSSLLDGTRWTDDRNYVWYVRYPAGDPEGIAENLKTWLKDRAEYLYEYYTQLKEERDAKQENASAEDMAESGQEGAAELDDIDILSEEDETAISITEDRIKMLEEVYANEWFEKETFAAPVDTKNYRDVLVELELTNGERVQHKVTPDMLLRVRGNVLQISRDEQTEVSDASSSAGESSSSSTLTQLGSGAEGALLDVGRVESNTPEIATERKIQEYHIPKVKKIRFITSFV